MKSEIEYIFKWVTVCEMCHNPTSNNKILGQRLNKSQGLNPKKKIGISVKIQQCNNCGLIYSNPQPRPIDIQDHYGVPPEDYWDNNYFNWDKSYFSKEINETKKLLSFKKGMRALDIGCGVGKCIKSLEESGFIASGIESSVSFYNKALSHMNIKKEQIKLGMIEEVEYTEKFDFITYGAVFEHLYHPAEVLEKVSHWLNDNGIVHIEVPSSKHLISRIINLYYKLTGVNYVTNLSPMHSPYHLYEFDINSFKKLSERLGFEIVEHYYSVCSIYFIPKFFHPILKWYMKKNNSGMQLTVYLKKISI